MARTEWLPHLYEGVPIRVGDGSIHARTPHFLVPSCDAKLPPPGNVWDIFQPNDAFDTFPLALAP